MKMIKSAFVIFTIVVLYMRCVACHTQGSSLAFAIHMRLVCCVFSFSSQLTLRMNMKKAKPSVITHTDLQCHFLIFLILLGSNEINNYAE